MSNIAISFFPNWEQKLVYKIRNSKLVENVELIDTKTLQRYPKDVLYNTAQKAFLIFLFTPVLMFFKIAFNCAQMAFDYAKSYIESTVVMAKALKNRDIIKILETVVTSRIDFARYIAEDIIAIVRAPFYTLAIEFAAIFTMFYPTQGIKIIADLERSWNNNISVKFDYRYNEEAQKLPLYKLFWNIMLNRKENIVFYLAHCIQSHGYLNDKHIVWYQDIQN